MQDEVFNRGGRFKTRPLPSPEPDGFEDYRNLFSHYLQTFWRRRLQLMLWALLAGLATAALSLVLLFTNPRYTATAITTVLPTDSAIEYTQDWLGRSLIDPSTIGTVTHLEEMHSRPVMERALGIVLENYDPVPSSGWRARVRETFQNVSTELWRTYSILNYGEFNPPSEYEQRLHMLRSGIEITPMQASYILRVEANLPDPELAKLAANAVVQAYAEQSQSANEQSAESLRTFLQNQIAEREQKLVAATRRLGRLQEAVATPLTGDAARFGLETARADLAAAQAELAQLRAEGAEEASAGGEKQLERRVALLQARLAEAEEQQVRLEGDRDEILEMERAVAGLEAYVARLRDRLLVVDLSTTEGLSRVNVVEPAQMPSQPASPKILNYTLSSVVAALLIGGVAVVLRDIFDDRIQTPANFSRITKGHSFGMIGRRAVRAARRRKTTRLSRDRQLLALTQAMLLELSFRRETGGAVHICGLREARKLTKDVALALETAAKTLGHDIVTIRPDVPIPLLGQVVHLVPHTEPATEILRSPQDDGDITLCLAARGQLSKDEVLKFAAEGERRLGGAIWFALVDPA